MTDQDSQLLTLNMGVTFQPVHPARCYASVVPPGSVVP